MFSDHLHGDFLPDENFGSASRHPARQVVSKRHVKSGEGLRRTQGYRLTAWCHWQLDPAAAAEAGAHSAAVEAVAAGLVMSDVE